MALHGSSSRFLCSLLFLLETGQGELGTLGMMSDKTSLPLAMSLPGNYNRTQLFVQKRNTTQVTSPSYTGTYLPLEFTVWPIPVRANGGGDVAADTALWEQVKGRKLLIVQKRVTLVLIAHRHGREELLAALWTGHAGATRCQVPPANTRCPLKTCTQSTVSGIPKNAKWQAIMHLKWFDISPFLLCYDLSVIFSKNAVLLFYLLLWKRCKGSVRWHDDSWHPKSLTSSVASSLKFPRCDSSGNGSSGARNFS